MKKRILTILAVITSLLAAAPALAKHHGYSVIFEVTVDAERHIALAISEVIEPSTGSTRPVDVKVPDSYVAAVRQKLEARADIKPGQHFFTYYSFDPDLPDELNLGG